MPASSTLSLTPFFSAQQLNNSLLDRSTVTLLYRLILFFPPFLQYLFFLVPLLARVYIHMYVSLCMYIYVYVYVEPLVHFFLSHN